MTERIARRLTDCGIPFEPDLPEKLTIYLSLLREWNARMDLTNVAEDEDWIDRHLCDSLIPLAHPGMIPDTGRVIDVGTGAGFPGLPLALAVPSAEFVLLDSQQKRLDFLRTVIDAVGADNVRLVHSRAEDGARIPELRGRFDLAMARAVAPLAVLAEYLLPYVRVNGFALCWKGPALAEEWESGRRACFLLGGKALEPIPAVIPGRDWQHCLLQIRKDRQTPAAYPRRAGTPTRSPLGGT